MNDFCVARISITSLLRADHGLWRAHALTLTSDACAAAEAILDGARRAAAQAQLHGAEAASAAVSAAQQQALAQAAALLDQIEQRHAQLLQGAQALAVDLALALFERALAETTPRERIEACCRRLLQDTPRTLIRPQLFLHPDDSALAPLPVPWEYQTDATLARGACRLEAGDGEWRADFAEGSAALRAAFASAALPACALAPAA